MGIDYFSMSMTDNSANNKRIAKNTLLLYFRMLLTTFVSFFTARITLQVLGVENYGIQNVVGGLISFMAVITGTMTSATQRFLAYELGKKDLNSYNKVFSMIMLIFIFMSIIILFIAELCGPWIIKDYLVIPLDRIYAAQWVYQCSVMVFLSSIMSIPYMSSLISYERMDIYAYMSFYDVGMKLLVVYLLCLSSYDKLITLSVLTMIVSVSSTTLYVVYCIRKLDGCRFKFYWNRKLFHQLMGYTGWNLFGSLSGTLNVSGVNILLNLFFGPVINAAKAIADKICGIVSSFSGNFYMAVAPQIIKAYASGEYERSNRLVLRSSKFSYYLLFILSLPVILLMPELLLLWLGKGQVSNEMIIFSRLILIYALVNVLEQPITMLIRATGNIRNYQVSVGVVTLLTVPLSYILFRYGFPSYACIIALTVVYAIAQVIRIIIAKRQVRLSIKLYVGEVILPILFVTGVSFSISYSVLIQFSNIIVKTIVGILFSFVITCLSIYVLGLSRRERKLCNDKLYSFVR